MAPKQETRFVPAAKALRCGRFDLSTWDQTFPCLYTPRFHCFSFKDDANPVDVFRNLGRAFARALAEWPDLCGTVVDQDVDRGTCALLVTEDAGAELKYCDYRGDGVPVDGSSTGWCFQDLASSGFPPSMLASPGLANFDRQLQTCPCPVFKAQVSVVQGGLILAMGFLHRVVDGECIRGFMRSWSGHSRLLSIGQERELEATASTDRRIMSRGLPGGQISDFPEFKLVESFAWASAASPVRVVSPVWRISKRGQELLKSEASARSTNDAICCRLWLSVSKARQLKQQDFESSNLSLGMNIRSRLEPPLDSYMGNATYRIGVTVDIQDLQTLDIATAAKKFRDALDSFTSDKFHQLIGFVNDLTSVKALQPSYRLHLGPDLFLTTHAHFGEFENSWGKDLGLPTAVRVLPVPAEGFCVVFSKQPDGALELMTSLSEDVFRRLRVDEEFIRYFELVCE